MVGGSSSGSSSSIACVSAEQTLIQTLMQLGTWQRKSQCDIVLVVTWCWSKFDHMLSMLGKLDTTSSAGHEIYSKSQY
jgi:hypothetical protein